jgi:tetratricopeptide (TPR) repeat protein
MNHLIQKPGNRSILETENRLGHINSLSWVVQQKQLLDSLEAQVYMPDERLFRMGKFWFNYYESLGNYAQIEQSFTLLRELIQKYPNSSRVEESEYLLLSFIDNVHFGFSCDRSPRGDYRLAYPALKQFLKDHPSSKKRPEILFRLVNALSWLKSDWRWAVPYLGLKNDLEEWAVAYQILSGEADKNMEILENEFPDFVRTSEECQKTITLRKREVWNNKWELEAVPQFPKFLRTDTIKFDIRILNRSLTAQILDTIFLDYWSWNIRFHFEMEPPSGCERREIGDFSVYHPGKLSRYGPVTVQPGSWYKEAFYVLPQTARLDKPGKYFFSFLYQHPELKWLSVTGKGGTIEIVE